VHGCPGCACLAIAEVQPVHALDPFLAAFREQPFNTGGLRRATGTAPHAKPWPPTATLREGKIIGHAAASQSGVN
jgi:hypothetical protein